MVVMPLRLGMRPAKVSPYLVTKTFGHCCGNRVACSVQPRAHAGPARQAAVHFLSMMVHARVRPICRRIRRAAREGAAVEARSGTILLLAALIPLCDAASARGPKPTQPGPANSPTVSDVSQGARALVLSLSRHRPEREPGRRAVQRASRHGSRPGL